MSFIVKNYDLPQNCGECPILDELGDYPMCLITRETRGYNFPVRDRRMDKCPLADVSEIATVIDCDIYDKETTIRGCTVQILENTVTGKTSVGWWRNEEDKE